MKPIKRPAHPPSSLRADGIAHVGLKVSNLGRSRRFYRKILGLRDEPHDPGVVYVPSGKDRLVLYKEGKGMTDIHFGFHVDARSKVDKWRDWLKKNEVPIHEDITEDGKYRSIKFQDPDGYWIEIFYEPQERSVMTEVALGKFRLKPDKKHEWLHWCQELNRRRDEVLETLRNEGVLVEACFLASNEDCIYYFMEAENFERARKASSTSRYRIDEEHRRHRRASMEAAEKLRCLFYFKNRGVC